jgi:hypothetical protein
MNKLERLRLLIEKGDPAFVLSHDPTLAPEPICAALRASLPKPVTVAYLRSDAISAEDASVICDALFGGRVLLLIAPEAVELPAMLLDAWAYFREDPQHSSSSAGRFIRFNPEESAERDLGVLGLVLPKTFGGLSAARIRDFIRISIDDPGELGASAAPIDKPIELGRPAVAVSMKTLCFLHQRDPSDAKHHEGINSIMRDQHPLTWRDVQSVLRAQANNDMLATLEEFEAGGRLTAGQLDLAAAAVSFLRRERDQSDVRVGSRGLAPSIYHLLWTYTWLQERGCVFRGQRDSRWRQDTTLLRSEKDGVPADLGTLLVRLSRTQTFLDTLAEHEQELVGRTLTDEERLAIAQHYGLPTPLLDYTRSLAIAAFFATGMGDPSSLREGDVGVIYFVNPRDPVARPPGAGRPDGFGLAQALGLRFGNLRTIEPELPDSENRIARQQGLFLEGFASRDLQRLSVGVLYFRQQRGEAFEDPYLGITRGQLLAPDTKLQQLADSIVSGPPKLSVHLLGVRLPEDDLLGALGLKLSDNLNWGQDVLDRLATEAERVEPGLWNRLRDIVARHFDEARIAALTAEVGVSGKIATRCGDGGIDFVLDEVSAALEELADLAGLESDALTRLLWEHRPLLSAGAPPDTMSLAEVELPDATPKGQLVLAAGLFLVGLEHLRVVHGGMALEFLKGADLKLGALARELGNEP